MEGLDKRSGAGRIDLPVGSLLRCAGSACPALFTKKSKRFCFVATPNQIYNPRCLVPQKGRIAIVTNAERDAMDAGGASDEGAGLRTAKSCGPDASTLAFKSRGSIREVTVTKSPITGESAKETVKTIA